MSGRTFSYKYSKKGRGKGESFDRGEGKGAVGAWSLWSTDALAFGEAGSRKKFPPLVKGVIGDFSPTQRQAAAAPPNPSYNL
jgi:hypothetical protein